MQNSVTVAEMLEELHRIRKKVETGPRLRRRASADLAGMRGAHNRIGD